MRLTLSSLYAFLKPKTLTFELSLSLLCLGSCRFPFLSVFLKPLPYKFTHSLLLCSLFADFIVLSENLQIQRHHVCVRVNWKQHSEKAYKNRYQTLESIKTVVNIWITLYRGNTLDSHRLMHFAGQQGLNKQHNLMEVISLGYFTQAKFIGDKLIVAHSLSIARYSPPPQSLPFINATTKDAS
nr:hypothetical protein CFP56_71507 [Quercus suber]